MEKVKIEVVFKTGSTSNHTVVIESLDALQKTMAIEKKIIVNGNGGSYWVDLNDVSFYSITLLS